MAIFKCKMCGGTLDINDNQTVATCEYCGTQQTLPKLDDEKRANMYDRANHFRRNNDYDKAAGIYEQILAEDKTDAEAYWSLVLCRYGIEYVEDPQTHKRVPTVNRAQYTSVFDDDNYKSALNYADGMQKTVYQAEAKAINDIQKGILAVSQNEEPFDVFICYKETDENGRRTPDSVLANDLYYQLTQEGFKVFFARITLEDKLGTAYEPYIFAALNSAKVMVVVGTKPQYFNAVWVRNEWSRYLALIKNGAKKILIPAYKDMDPYDLPEEFSHLQAQDMSKLGFMQDLVRGIKKLTAKDEPKTVVKEVAAGGAPTNIAPLLKRVFIFLEDGNWDSADEYCEKVLDVDPENAQAYLGKLMASLHARKVENLQNCTAEFSRDPNYAKVVRYGDEKLTKQLDDYNKEIRLRNLYNNAKHAMNEAESSSEFKTAKELFLRIKDYSDSASLAQECEEKMQAAIVEEQERAELEREEQEKKERKRKLEEKAQKARDEEEKKQKQAEEAAKRAKAIEEAKRKKKTKTITAILIAIPIIAFIIMCIVVSIQMQYINVDRDGIRYYRRDGEDFFCASSADYDVSGSLEILPEVNGIPVKEIPKEAFADCKHIKEIKIPSSITTIGASAFQNCRDLTSVTIVEGVTSIGDYAFYGCSSLTSIVIPNSVTYLGAYAFGETSLQSAVIGDGVTSIGEWTFARVYSLKTVTLGKSVKTIGSYAFGQSGLTTITLPAGLTSMDDPFSYCSRLERIDFQGTMAQWESVQKVDRKWNYNTGDYKVYCTDGTLDKSGAVVEAAVTENAARIAFLMTNSLQIA